MGSSNTRNDAAELEAGDAGCKGFGHGVSPFRQAASLTGWRSGNHAVMVAPSPGAETISRPP